jgi:hypothetical protein
LSGLIIAIQRLEKYNASFLLSLVLLHGCLWQQILEASSTSLH